MGSAAAAPGQFARTMRLAGALALVAAIVVARWRHDRPAPTRGTAAVEVTYASPAALRAALVRHPAALVQDVPALRVAEVRPTGDTTRYIRSLRRASGIVAARRVLPRAEADAPGLTLGVVSTPAGGAYEWQWYATGVDRVPATILAAAARTTIAIVDTGADLSAPALAGKVKASYDVRSGSRSVARHERARNVRRLHRRRLDVRGRGSRRLRRRRAPPRRQGRRRNLRQRRRRGGGNRPLGAERRADRQRQPRRAHAFGRGGERGGLRRAARRAGRRSSRQRRAGRQSRRIPRRTAPAGRLQRRRRARARRRGLRHGRAAGDVLGARVVPLAGGAGHDGVRRGRVDGEGIALRARRASGRRHRGSTGSRAAPRMRRPRSPGRPRSSGPRIRGSRRSRLRRCSSRRRAAAAPGLRSSDTA